ncbi:hypothetical protein RGQ15_07975 [Paracoccus sp. MBLB3053]|uniref:Uncharacterized protein n=1 Tax=Paracoccus aurantius TaxID=3073814 RepID=A0ABU2HR46_9RHOB|nr:hypothetical protein [Paracoccus sp. MBLB3053]MDS9467511.1 hypothetical protein [Paracoccus sp. MBLB3053]
MICFNMPSLPTHAVNATSYATIALSPYQSAQGPVLQTFADGKVMIDTGREILTGRPLTRDRGNARIWSPLFAGFN